MPLSVSQLSNPPTRAEITSWLLKRLREFGFQTTGWQEGRIQQTILNTVATGASAFVQLAADTVKNVYNDEAEGAGLTLYASHRFDNTRTGGDRAAGPFNFANSGTSPFAVVAGAIIVEDANGQQFSNTEAGTIPASGNVDLDMRAILVGSNGNIDNNSTLTLVTPLAGVTVTNPGPGDLDLDGSNDPWYTIATGSDPEPDITLRQRNSTKWGLLAVEKAATAYENLALAQTGISKVKVIHDNPRGPGTVDVYVASGATLVGTAEKEAAQAAFADYTFQTESVWPPLNTPNQSAVEIMDPPVLELNIQGVVYYDPQYTSDQVQANLVTALDDFVTLIPMGGYEYVSSNGLVTLGDILEVMEGAVGVRSVTLTTPTGNIDPSETTLITAPSDWITGKLTFSAVTS